VFISFSYKVVVTGFYPENQQCKSIKMQFIMKQSLCDLCSA